MNGFMMFKKTIDCHIVEEPHRDTFKHGNRDWKYVPTKAIFRNKLNNNHKTDE